MGREKLRQPREQNPEIGRERQEESGRTGEDHRQDEPLVGPAGSSSGAPVSVVPTFEQRFIDKWLGSVLALLILTLIALVSLAWIDGIRRDRDIVKLIESHNTAELEQHRVTQSKLDRNYQQMGELGANDMRLLEDDRFIIRMGGVCGK